MGLFNKKDKKPSANLSSKTRLDVEVKKEGAAYTFLLEGRLDTITSPNLECKINDATPDATKLILDFAKLDYITSPARGFVFCSARHRLWMARVIWSFAISTRL